MNLSAVGPSSSASFPLVLTKGEEHGPSVEPKCLFLWLPSLSRVSGSHYVQHDCWISWQGFCLLLVSWQPPACWIMLSTLPVCHGNICGSFPSQLHPLLDISRISFWADSYLCSQKNHSVFKKSGTHFMCAFPPSFWLVILVITGIWQCQPKEGSLVFCPTWCVGVGVDVCGYSTMYN